MGRRRNWIYNFKIDGWTKLSTKSAKKVYTIHLNTNIKNFNTVTIIVSVFIWTNTITDKKKVTNSKKN